MIDKIRGRVLKAQSGFFSVETDAGILVCQLRGRLKKGRKQGDILAIGDWVQVSEQEPGKGMVEEVEPRESMLYRMAPTPRGEYQQIIIANPDQAVFVFSTAMPEPRLNMLDRFLVITEKEEINSIIVANKIDLTGMKKAREYFKRYQKIGYQVLYTSVIKNRGIKALKKELIGKTNVFAGPSGAGKTSILNAIQPGLGLSVKEVSGANKKGKHTTVSRKLVPLSEGGYVADTPGLKALDLWDDYTDYKKEMFNKTDTEIAPWKVIKANRKTKARIEAIEHILDTIPYEFKDQSVIEHVSLGD